MTELSPRDNYALYTSYRNLLRLYPFFINLIIRGSTSVRNIAVNIQFMDKRRNIFFIINIWKIICVTNLKREVCVRWWYTLYSASSQKTGRDAHTQNMHLYIEKIHNARQSSVSITAEEREREMRMIHSVTIWT
jgi:hypothetical protein